MSTSYIGVHVFVIQCPELSRESTPNIVADKFCQKFGNHLALKKPRIVLRKRMHNNYKKIILESYCPHKMWPGKKIESEKQRHMHGFIEGQSNIFGVM